MPTVVKMMTQMTESNAQQF